MTQISITTNLPIVRKRLEDLTAEIPKVGRERLYRTAQKIQRRMRKPGKAVRYPVKWDSEKQRRAFFATNGFGRGIPARRTGAYNAAWGIVRKDTGYMLVSPLAYSKYVGGNAYGLAQSGIHKDRWPMLRDVVEDEIKNLPKEIEQDINLVSRRVMPK